MTTKYLVQKGTLQIGFTLLDSAHALLISVNQSNQQQSLLFEKSFTFNQLYSKDALFCSSWEALQQAIQHAATHLTQNIILSPEGVISLHYEVHLLGRTVQQTVEFVLMRKLQCQEEVGLLRAQVGEYQNQLSKLRQNMGRLQLENQAMNTRLVILEQLVLGKKGIKLQDKQKSKLYEGEPVRETLKKEDQEIKIKDEKTVKEEHISLKLDVDPNSLHYDRFKVTQNTITSLYEDYYQVQWRQPLPQKGSAKIRIRTKAKNHCSVGLICESELKNQYSFQNKNSVCLYTYFYGYFRGLYVRGEYHALDWGMEVGEVVQMDFDLSKGTFTLCRDQKPEVQVVDIKELQKQKMYFFLQMYEKDNCLEVLGC